jgi:hypothetical protein
MSNLVGALLLDLPISLVMLLVLLLMLIVSCE